MTIKRFGLALAVLAMVAYGSAASAATVDLTSGSGSSGSINGALFEFSAQQPSGTGFVGSFLRIQRRGTEQGYNTSGRPAPFDVKQDEFTRDLTFGEVPIIERDGVQYLEFMLDVNEPRKRGKRLINLVSVQIFSSSVGGQTTTDLSSLGTLHYDMGGNGNKVILNAKHTAGSGESDMAMLVPLANFAGLQASDFIYLYSRFSHSQGGFEEWWVREVTGGGPPDGGNGGDGGNGDGGNGDGGGPDEAPVIPTPGAVPMGLALLSLLGWFKRRAVA